MAPPIGSQSFRIRQIERSVATDLFSPKLLSGFGPFEKLTIMAMPKAAVHKNYRVIFWQNEVGFARQSSVMQPKPETHFMKAAPDNHFRLGILGLDSGHHSAADFPTYDISQALPPIRDLAG